jgi:hypothetical protein
MVSICRSRIRSIMATTSARRARRRNGCNKPCACRCNKRACVSVIAGPWVCAAFNDTEASRIHEQDKRASLDQVFAGISIVRPSGQQYLAEKVSDASKVWTTLCSSTFILARSIYDEISQTTDLCLHRWHAAVRRRIARTRHVDTAASACEPPLPCHLRTAAMRPRRVRSSSTALQRVHLPFHPRHRSSNYPAAANPSARIRQMPIRRWPMTSSMRTVIVMAKSARPNINAG